MTVCSGNYGLGGAQAADYLSPDIFDSGRILGSRPDPPFSFADPYRLPASNWNYNASNLSDTPAGFYSIDVAWPQ
ncbi:MAG: hypothetical protein DRP64_09780 [Verrucomicrobia bacterium]|nr:MAG: hypothetical protein DRP64_09780 [Verrucomicrobiota bacterium]